MFYYIKGKVSIFLENGIVLENNDIGYEIHVPQLSMNYIKEKKDKILIYTVMMVREDDISLYGFISQDDKSMFQKLLTVNGVGAKAALSIMSIYITSELKKIIIFEDDKALTKAAGIGKKTAQRIVLELKDKLEDIEYQETPYEASRDTKEIREEVIEALLGLGYSKFEASQAVAKIKKDTVNVEELIKSALINLSRE